MMPCYLISALATAAGTSVGRIDINMQLSVDLQQLRNSFFLLQITRQDVVRSRRMQDLIVSLTMANTFSARGGVSDPTGLGSNEQQAQRSTNRSQSTEEKE